MHTLRAFEATARIDQILVVLAPDDNFTWPSDLSKRIELVRIGGTSRAHSVFNGLTHLLNHQAQPHDWVLVHDAARCLITPALIDTLINACLPDTVGGLLALPCPDTLKIQIEQNPKQGNMRSSATLPRADKWLAQTPQMFRLGSLHTALQTQLAQNFDNITDEASAIERTGVQPLLVRGSALNFKVTWPEDLILAQAVLANRQNFPSQHE
jgi:2-C-methyl-D-erythritol 4-phosphate cytidylyltransferase